MNFEYLIAGIFLITIVAVDFLWTTLWIEKGAGPLTSRMMTAVWNVFRQIGVRHSWGRTLAGPLMVLVGLMMWIVLLWIGWTFVFATAENAVRDTIDGGSISWIERLYFVGYSLFTLGNGELVPRDGIWQIATVFTTASGMLLITLSISYVIAILNAVTQKRSFATSVSGLGSRGEAVVTESWNGESELERRIIRRGRPSPQYVLFRTEQAHDESRCLSSATLLLLRTTGGHCRRQYRDSRRSVDTLAIRNPRRTPAQSSRSC